MKKVFWREFALLLFAGSLSASRSQGPVRFSTAPRFTRRKISVRDRLLPFPDSLANFCPHLALRLISFVMRISLFFISGGFWTFAFDALAGRQDVLSSLLSAAVFH